MDKRLEELDSLRGLAALSVVFLHLIYFAPKINLIETLSFTPLRFMWSGQEAVLLFFVLSGFVLSLPYLSGKAPTYKYYVIKRILRIYIPYFVSITAAILLMALTFRAGASEVGGWFDVSQEVFSLKPVVDHIIMLGHYDPFKFNGVIWSLVHEMRISLIFPLIMILAMKLDWRIGTLITATISILFFLIYFVCLKFYQYDITASMTSYISTVRYIPFFLLGILLAKQRNYFREYYKKISLRTKVLLIVAGLLAYTYTGWFFPNVTIFHLSFLEDWAVGIGSSIFILFSINSKTLKSFMLVKPIHFIGKISYSIYLYHMIVMLSLVHGLYGKLPIGLIMLVSVPVSIIVAALMYYLIEKPSMTFGRNLTRKKVNSIATVVSDVETVHTAK